MKRPGDPKMRAVLWVSLAVNLVFLGRLVIARRSPRHDADREYRRERAEMLASLDTRAPELVLLGDSLTDRGEWGELLGPGTVNRGIAGDRVRDAAGRVAEIGKRAPKRVAVMVGVNDLIAGATVEQVMTDYRELLAALAREAPQAKIFVESVLPVRPIRDGRRVRPGAVRALNARLQALAAERGATFVDVAARFATPDGTLAPELTADGVHLAARGYQLWAETLRREVLGSAIP